MKWRLHHAIGCPTTAFCATEASDGAALQSSATTWVYRGIRWRCNAIIRKRSGPTEKSDGAVRNRKDPVHGGSDGAALQSSARSTGEVEGGLICRCRRRRRARAGRKPPTRQRVVSWHIDSTVRILAAPRASTISKEADHSLAPWRSQIRDYSTELNAALTREFARPAPTLDQHHVQLMAKLSRNSTGSPRSPQLESRPGGMVRRWHRIMNSRRDPPFVQRPVIHRDGGPPY